MKEIKNGRLAMIAFLGFAVRTPASRFLFLAWFLCLGEALALQTMLLINKTATPFPAALTCNVDM